MFTLYKRSNGIFYLKYFDEPGSEKRISTKVKTKREALSFISRFKKQLEAKSTAIVIKYDTAKEKYLQYCKINYSKKYHTIMKETLDNFGNTIGNIEVKRIIKDDCQLFISEKYKTAKYSAHQQFRNLRTFFNWCIANDYLETSPTAKIKPPKLPEKKPVWINENEFLEILNKETKEELKDIYSLLFYTGLRANELLSLEWDNIDLENRMIHLRNTSSFTTKSGAERDLPLNDKAYQIIQRQKTRFKGGYLFKKNSVKYRVEYVSKQFKKAVREARLNEKIHLHSLRHSFASNLIKKGEPIYNVSKLLGHSKISTTEIYSHLRVEDLRETINQI